MLRSGKVVARPDKHRARAAALGAALAGLLGVVFAAGPGSARGQEYTTQKPVLATTGNHSELVETVPITSLPAADQQVVMSIGPEQLRTYRAGDRLRVSAEVQVSTTCVSESPRCVGKSYDFNPIVGAQIVLSSAPQAGLPAVPLSEPRQVRCKQRRPNRNHHCTLVMPNLETTLGDPSTLPCEPTACYVNLIVGASHPSAVPGDVVVVGADRPDGSVAGDKGRLNVIQARADVPAPRASSSTTLVNATLPVTEPNKVKRRVVYSVPVPAPKAGEVFAFDGSYVSGIAAFSFNAFISSRVIVGETPTSTVPTGIAKLVTDFSGRVTESNGFNCTKGRSGYRDPCTSVKAGAAQFTHDAVDAAGQPVTLYVNLVAASKPLLTRDATEYHRVGLQALYGLTVLRYAP